MSGFIPQITTRVSVETDTTSLDECLGIIDGSEILSSCFTEIRDYLNDTKREINNLKDPSAEAVATTLSAWQSQIISTKHKVSGMMMNSVDVMHDGDGVYMVGNTAMSVDGFPYPLAIEEGTKDHWVEPVTFSYLHWKDKLTGEDRFSKGHMVSGIKADPFVQYSIENTEAELEALLMTKINNIMK